MKKRHVYQKLGGKHTEDKLMVCKGREKVLAFSLFISYYFISLWEMIKYFLYESHKRGA